MKKSLKITLVVLSAVSLLGFVSIIDYFIAMNKGEPPVLALSKESDSSQYVEYKGLFYKMWINSVEKTEYTNDLR